MVSLKASTLTPKLHLWTQCGIPQQPSDICSHDLELTICLPKARTTRRELTPFCMTLYESFDLSAPGFLVPAGRGEAQRPAACPVFGYPVLLCVLVRPPKTKTWVESKPKTPVLFPGVSLEA